MIGLKKDLIKSLVLVFGIAVPKMDISMKVFYSSDVLEYVKSFIAEELDEIEKRIETEMENLFLLTKI